MSMDARGSSERIPDGRKASANDTSNITRHIQHFTWYIVHCGELYFTHHTLHGTQYILHFTLWTMIYYTVHFTFWRMTLSHFTRYICGYYICGYICGHVETQSDIS